MKKILIWICLLALLVSVVSCAKTPDNSADTTKTDTVAETTGGKPAETTAVTEFSKIPVTDYGKHNFNIFYSQTDDCYLDFFSEAMDGSVQNDAVYSRNLKVMDTFNIILNVTWDSYSAVNERVKQQIQTGDTDFDMYGGHRSSLPLSYGGYLYDFTTMSEINLDGEWWDQAWVRDMTVSGSLYNLIGDIGISTLLFNASICFNKNLFDINGLEYLYKTVDEGKWTYEVLFNLIKDFGKDVNNDGKRTWDEDVFGITGWASESGYCLFYGSGFSFMNRDTEGNFALDYDEERLVNITEKMVEIWSLPHAYFNKSTDTSQHAYPFEVFSSGRSLFCDIVLSKIAKFFNDMEDDYGILPEPKADEEQKEYYSYTGITIPIIMVPENCPDPERTGRIMEALCTASYDSVTPKMYEVVTKTQNARDEDSGRMIEIIIRNKKFDAAHFFELSGYGTYSRSMIAAGNTSAISYLTPYKRVAERQWDVIITAFEKQKAN